MKRSLIFALAMVASVPVQGGELEDVLACIKAAERHAGITLDPAKATYEFRFFSRSSSTWPNARCEVDLGTVYNLKVNNKEIVIDEFIGREAFDLNQRLESDTNRAVKALESKIRALKDQQASVTRSLKAPNADREALAAKTHKVIADALNADISEAISCPPCQQAATPTQVRVPPRDPQPGASSTRSSKAWVSANSLNSRTCASTDCGVVKVLNYGSEISVLERRNGWVRITDYADARCANGKTPTVTRGNNICEEKNGITANRVAEWVAGQHLASTRPAPKKRERSNWQGQFGSMAACLDAIQRQSGQHLRVLKDTPSEVSGLLSNREFFSCTLKSTGTRGTYYEGYYSSR